MLRLKEQCGLPVWVSLIRKLPCILDKGHDCPCMPPLGELYGD